MACVMLTESTVIPKAPTNVVPPVFDNVKRPPAVIVPDSVVVTVAPPEIVHGPQAMLYAPVKVHPPALRRRVPAVQSRADDNVIVTFAEIVMLVQYVLAVFSVVAPVSVSVEPVVNGLLTEVRVPVL